PRMICRRARSTASFTVASTRCTCERMVEVVSSTLRTITSNVGRSSVSIACAVSIVGRALVFTSSESASRRALVVRMVRYMAARRPACKSTATPVKAINSGVRFSIVILPNSTAECTELQVLGRRGFRGRLLIGLATGLVGGAELILLLIHDVASPINPLGSLLAGLAGASTNVFSSFLGPSEQSFPRLATRTRRVQHSYHSAQASV